MSLQVASGRGGSNTGCYHVKDEPDPQTFDLPVLAKRSRAGHSGLPWNSGNCLRMFLSPAHPLLHPGTCIGICGTPEPGTRHHEAWNSGDAVEQKPCQGKPSLNRHCTDLTRSAPQAGNGHRALECWVTIAISRSTAQSRHHSRRMACARPRHPEERLGKRVSRPAAC